MIAPETCLRIYGEAWFEPDPERRIALLGQCCSEDVLFIDPALGRLRGLRAVSDMIGHYRKAMAAVEGPDGAGLVRERGLSAGGVSVDVVTELEQLHGFFRYSFVWTMPDGREAGGTDFGEFAEDGRMRLITVWPGTADFPVSHRGEPRDLSS